MLTILANGYKLAPFVIFKGNKDSPNIRKELIALDIVKNGKIFYEINENAWCTGDIMTQWINKVWVKYINSLGFHFQSILFLDHASMHLKDEIQSELINNDVICHYIPKGITGVMQPLDVCVNKSFKDSLRKKYIDYCIDLKEIKNIKVEKIYLNGLMRFGILL